MAPICLGAHGDRDNVILPAESHRRGHRPRPRQGRRHRRRGGVRQRHAHPGADSGASRARHTFGCELAAVRWLRANEARLGLATERPGIWGMRHGRHLRRLYRHGG
jgi:hypothetical protein